MEVTILAAVSAFNAPRDILDDPREYLFSLEPKAEDVYIYKLYETVGGRAGSERGRDVLEEGDVSFLYLNYEDAVPDLKVAYSSGTIKLTNLHYLSPDSTSLILRNASNQVILPHVIRMARSGSLVASINATGWHQAPTVRVQAAPAVYQGNLNLGTSSYQGNQTLVGLSFTAPPVSTAVILDVIATVGGQETHAYYTLAVGDVVYALKEANFPELEMKMTGTGAELTVIFSPTQRLQPFALPCTPDDANPVTRSDASPEAVFDDDNIQAVYTYNTLAEEPSVWRRGIPSDIRELSPFVGYFVELAQPQQTTLTLACRPQNIYPMTTVPPPLTAPQTMRIREGWTLFSLPGTVPRPLTDFTPEEDFRLFECRQGELCAELAINTFLNPGKPYWIYTARSFTIGYRLE